MTSAEYAYQDLIDFPTADELLRMYERMLLIRRAEEQLGSDSKAGKLPGNVHLYIGQEAIAVGVCAHLTDRDKIGSTHRGHGHFLAKGGEVSAMIAEIYGKETGVCHGFGGSMHVADFSKGILGANGIVGGGIGITAGAAFAALLDGQGAVAVAFFGDGAASQGILSEVMNIAALWSLPLILVCEYNGYSEFSPSATVTAGKIGDRARPFGIPTETVDGNDLVAVWKATQKAVARARGGDGPSFIEAVSYRQRGHLEAEAGFIQEPYRTQEEVALWMERDPIPRLAARLRALNVADDEIFAGIESKVSRSVKDAVAFAQASASPDLQRALRSAFVDQEV